MNWEIILGLVGIVVSIAGLTWVDKATWAKLAFGMLMLIVGILFWISFSTQQSIQRIKGEIVASLGTSVMSADQLYEKMNPTSVIRARFDNALNEAIDDGLIAHDMLEFSTPHNTVIRVRVYRVSQKR
jgi:hypothetical protein